MYELGDGGKQGGLDFLEGQVMVCVSVVLGAGNVLHFAIRLVIMPGVDVFATLRSMAIARPVCFIC